MAVSPPLKPQDRRFKFFRSVAALMLREMSTRYGRSPGGYLWAILEPAGAIALLSVVFALVVRTPALGTNFPLFFATGYLIFSLYNSVGRTIAFAIRFSRALLSYPAVTFMDALTARFLLNVLTDLVVMAVILSGIVLIYDLQLIMYWPAVFSALGMTLVLTIGVGTINCYLMSSFPIWNQIWTIISRPMFLLSGVIFIPEIVPTQFRDWLMLNPLIHGTSEMRKGFYATYDAVHVVPLYPYLFGLVLAIFGMLLLLRNHKDIVLK
ncbi:sugar ABC transporter permease [Rhodobacteraceae bacterium CCMM004]|nr:sugar ABC transporter permease [Rhodobacteraceae bacterium CCMM004]